MHFSHWKSPAPGVQSSWHQEEHAGLVHLIHSPPGLVFLLCSLQIWQMLISSSTVFVCLLTTLKEDGSSCVSLRFACPRPFFSFSRANLTGVLVRTADRRFYAHPCLQPSSDLPWETA